MNIEEAKEKLHQLAFKDLNTKPDKLRLQDVYAILDQLIQPQPEVPQFVADWYEKHKDNLEEGLCYMVWLIRESGAETDFEYWLTETENPIQTLINMHQFGYTVEKEKLYTVEIPDPNERQLSFVLMRQLSGNISIKVMHRDNLDLLKIDNNLHLTEQEIRKDFDWAWQFREEVE
ncbi:DUF1642 domain-containing protein [Streptococcus agalactiae]|uniref:DUF1642 domain-containing protein n=1 Tax=Streptococcus agalactiae TaxID=1311 RepID=UPI000332D7CF|nr:DUF1642 domain-containing protein [Streptococcus agalactiae]OTG48700.1 hypothetical protein B7934_03300 [Streptococcus agalactiae]QBX20697.1 hypothetical protein Javan53_0038 [Streptococcus phage Javan53]CCW39607.1 conserved hypothetical protein-phage associated [Streptococcus agalactiae ILRI005]